MKKRVLSVLVAVMLVACMFTSAMASSVTFEAAPEKVEPGKEVTVTLTAPAVEGAKAATIQTKIVFDNTQVELVKYDAPTVEGGSKMQSSVDDANKAGAYTSTYNGESGENTIDLSKDIVWEATFKVLETATAVEFTVDTFYVEGLEADGVTAIDYYTKDDVAGKLVVELDVPCAHNWVEKEGKDATCTEAGYTAYQECSICHEIKGQEVIEAKGHTYGDWTEWTHTGEVAEGEECKECTMERTRTCSVCNYVDKETKKHNDNPETGDTMSAVLFLAMAAMFVAGIVVVNKARKHA